MKYFTSEWWEKQDEDWEPIRQYETYLDTVKTKLPAPLLDLWDEHTLHDAKVKYIESRFQRQSVKIDLDGWNRGFQKAVRYTLYFGGVSEFDQVLPRGPYGEQELGDLGYWECELLSSLVEVRMLFVSGAEFRIVFKEFSFACQPREV